MEEREPEIWKDIPGYEGLYQVSSWGRIRKTNTYKIRKNQINEKGYLTIKLKSKKIKIHRLVAEVFIPNPNNYPLVMHLNDIRDDNYYKNLQFGTYKMNNDDMRLKKRSYDVKGEEVGTSILLEKQVIKIKKTYTGKRGEITKLANEYKVSISTISDIINKRTWKHI